MPDTNIVLTALRNELATAGLIRKPDVAGGLPPAFVEPRGGAPAPGEREAPETDGLLVLTIRLGGELSEGRFNAYRRRLTVDLIYRTRGTPGLQAGRALDAAIRKHLVGDHDTNALGFRLDEPDLNVQVLESGVWAGLGPVSDVDDVRTDRSSLMLEVLADT